MATASEVLRIAAGEIGYSRWTDPQPGTKYGRWYAQSHGSYYGASGVPFCAMFVSWVMSRAGQAFPGLPAAYVPYVLSAGRSRAVSTRSAKPGDIVIFNWDGGVVDHIGFVEANHGSYIQTIEGNTKVNATGGAGGAAIGGGAGAENNSDNNGNQITIKSNENGSPTINAVGGGTDEGEKIVIGGAGIGAGCESNADADITLEGKVTITATAGKDNVAIGANGIEQEFSGLAEGSSITRYDPEGNDITLPTDPVPAVPSSSGGSSADASVQESVFPGLVVTDKDGQRISYTSIRDNNVLSLRVGRFTASLRASLATLRQLRAEGIDTITFQTILCSTTLSVDELLVMGGEDTEVVLTHHIRSSTLTVGGKAV